MGRKKAPLLQVDPADPVVMLAQHLEGADHDDSAADIFQEFIGNAGFSSFTCRRFKRSEAIGRASVLVATTPRAWRDLYYERGFSAHDPILTELKNQGCSFIWSERLITSDALTAQAQELMQEASAHGLVDGFAVSIHEAGGYVGTVVLAAPASVSLDPAGRTALSLASVYFYQRVCALRAAAQRGAGQRLSPREIEILQWITEGKSDWQIGRILAISDKTVNYHIENVKRKFGVATRVQAVVSAIQQGSLTY